jgi:hypothetical protein
MPVSPAWAGSALLWAPGTNSVASPEKTQFPVDQSFARKPMSE